MQLNILDGRKITKKKLISKKIKNATERTIQLCFGKITDQIIVS